MAEQAGGAYGESVGNLFRGVRNCADNGFLDYEAEAGGRILCRDGECVYLVCNGTGGNSGEYDTHDHRGDYRGGSDEPAIRGALGHRATHCVGVGFYDSGLSTGGCGGVCPGAVGASGGVSSFEFQVSSFELM